MTTDKSKLAEKLRQQVDEIAQTKAQIEYEKKEQEKLLERKRAENCLEEDTKKVFNWCEEAAAEGKATMTFGSYWVQNIVHSFNVRAIVQALEAEGFKITNRHVSASIDPDGAYSHDSYNDIIVTW